MELESILLIIGSGFLAGILNAVAGGGTFFTFPALIFAGVSPIAANATSTIAVWPGAVAAAIAYRKQLNNTRKELIILTIISLIGGGLGAIILLKTSEQTFEFLIPWLMLTATLLFMFGDKLKSAQTNLHATLDLTSAKSILLQSAIALYGGYFGAGIGILMLALLTMLHMRDIHQMNALKTILGSAINGVAVIVFLFSDVVDWNATLYLLPSAIIGGYFGGHYAQKVPKIWVKRFVIATGLAMTLWFFIN